MIEVNNSKLDAIMKLVDAHKTLSQSEKGFQNGVLIKKLLQKVI